eukprot:jgi/Mesen1/6234/ME000321S05302
MPDFLQKSCSNVLTNAAKTKTTNYCMYNNQLLQLFTSSLFIAGLFGGLVASYTTTHWGRVRTMLLSGIFFCIGAGLTGGAQFLAMLVIGRIFLGLGVGFANQAVPLYISEMAPAKMRGTLNQCFQMATTIGIVVVQLINYGTQNAHPWGWRLSLALAGMPAVMLTLGGLFLLETPNSLIEGNKLDKGLFTLKRARGVENVQVEFDDLLAASQPEGQRGTPPVPDHPQEGVQARAPVAVLIPIFQPIFQQLTGINANMFYVAPLFYTLGFGASTALYSAVITGAVNVLATLVSIFCVDRFGRKILFLVGGVQMFLMQLSTGVSALVVVFICVYVAGFAWSWGPLGWLVPSELQPLETRSAGQSITVASNFLFTFITKGVPLAEMSDIWRTHWFWATTAAGMSAAADHDVELRTGAGAGARAVAAPAEPAPPVAVAGR